MSVPAYYPYKSAEAKEAYLAFYDSMAASQWAIESESRIVPTSFDRTFVRISGPRSGPPLVLLPGMSAHSLLWAPNIAALSAVYRTYAVDRIGDVGRSESTRAVRCLDDFMIWLDELFHALELGDAIHLVGLSYGGWLAAQYALRFPKRLNKMVLLAPGGVLPPAIEFMLRGSLVLTRNRTLARSVVNWLFEDLARKDPARVEASLDRMMMGLQCLAMRRPPGASVMRDEELRSLRTPTLVLVGDHEKIYSPVKAIARLKSVAPQIQVEMIPGAGHDLTIVQAELVNRKILDFLAG